MTSRYKIQAPQVHLQAQSVGKAGQYIFTNSVLMCWNRQGLARLQSLLVEDDIFIYPATQTLVLNIADTKPHEIERS